MNADLWILGQVAQCAAVSAVALDATFDPQGLYSAKITWRAFSGT